MESASAILGSGTGAKTDRRTSDRRFRQPVLSRHTIFGGRRYAGRRVEDRRGYIADQHGTGIFIAVLAVAVLNILDAFYTVLFLSYGGTEMNPFVDWVLVNTGVWGFLLVKSLGIGFCIGFLTLTKNFTASRAGLVIVLVGYFALLGWHMTLLTQIPYLP